MGFLRRNSDALALELIGALVLGGVVAGAVFLFDQLREDERYENARALSQQQFDRAQQLANEQFAREASAARSGEYSFAAIDLRDTTLSGLELTNCPDNDPVEGKICTNFFQADFSGSTLIGTNLRGAYLQDANLSGTFLSNSVLRRSVGLGADLHCVKGLGTDFAESDLRYADFTDSSLNLAHFSGADLTNADFSGADLSLADFTDAVITDVTFDGAYFYGGQPPFGLPDEILNGLAAEDNYRDECP